MTIANSFLNFIVRFLFESYLYILLMRFIFQRLGLRWSNQIIQFIIKATDPLVKPLRRFIPGFKGFDMSILLWVLIVGFVELTILLSLNTGFFPGILPVLFVSIIQSLVKVIYIYMIAIILSALMSWFPRLQGGEIAELVQEVADPCLGLVRRYVPSLGGIDFSPIVVFFVFYIIKDVLLMQLLYLIARL